MTVDALRIPKSGWVTAVAPCMQATMRHITLPELGAVKVMRALVVSKAVIANRAVQEAVAAVAGSYNTAPSRLAVSQISKTNAPKALSVVVSFGPPYLIADAATTTSTP